MVLLPERPLPGCAHSGCVPDCPEVDDVGGRVLSRRVAVVGENCDSDCECTLSLDAVVGQRAKSSVVGLELDALSDLEFSMIRGRDEAVMLRVQRPAYPCPNPPPTMPGPISLPSASHYRETGDLPVDGSPS